jgi:hypothetical protein
VSLFVFIFPGSSRVNIGPYKRLKSQAAVAPLLVKSLSKMVFEAGASEIWNGFSSQMLKGSG